MISKTTVVFLPGKLCDQRLWQNTMDALSDIINPIFVDLRSQQSLEEMLRSVFNCCEGKFVLIGFSMGGYVAQEFVLKYPERIIGAAFIAVSGSSYSLEEKEYQGQIIDNIKQTGFKSLSSVAVQKFIHPSRYQNKELIDLIKDMSRESGSKTIIAQYLATINRVSRIEALSKVNCPIIIIASPNDQEISIESIKEMSDGIPESELHIIENCGHMIPLEEPEELNEILKGWLLSKVLN
jgi:pimeloyl-ACP methyl ester carboxylesterase